MLIIGLDPGSLNFGYGIIQAKGSDLIHITHGVIRNNSSNSMPERILKISTELNSVFQQYQPQYAAIERIFLSKNADSAFKLGHVRGVAILEAMKNRCSVTEYAAREVKKGINGFGGADKDQVLFMVRHILGIPDLKHFDASDALALAIFHSQRVELDLRLNSDINI